ncbi:MAG: hypothetical protein QNJ98_17345, partial [Planctomycetota bacterium]|nr:hypothetical protein [Planctomycetota bacterium]
MRLSLVFYAFIARMAIGTLIALIPIWAMRPAERHIRFQLLLTLVLAAGAAALYLPALGDANPEWPRGMAAFTSLEGGIPGMLLIVCVLCLVANALFGTFKRKAARITLAIAAVVGLVVVFGTARLAPYPGTTSGLLVLTLSGLLGGLVMASINDAMILGHFYLMIRGLPLAALKRSGIFVAVVLIAKMVLFGLVLLFWEGAADVLLGREIVWTTWRIAFG